MKKSIENAIEILKRGGCIPASEWTTGSGKHTSRRPTPEHCAEIEAARINAVYTGGERKGMYIVDLPFSVRLVLHDRAKARPQVKTWIYVCDLDALCVDAAAGLKKLTPARRPTYAERVSQLIAEGCTNTDAQAIADMEGLT